MNKLFICSFISFDISCQEVFSDKNLSDKKFYLIPEQEPVSVIPERQGSSLGGKPFY